MLMMFLLSYNYSFGMVPPSDETVSQAKNKKLPHHPSSYQRKTFSSPSMFSTLEEKQDEAQTSQSNSFSRKRKSTRPRSFFDSLSTSTCASQDTLLPQASPDSDPESSELDDHATRNQIVKNFFRNARSVTYLTTARRGSIAQKVSRNKRRESDGQLGREDGDGIFHPIEDDASSALSCIEDTDLKVIIDYCIEKYGIGTSETKVEEEKIIKDTLTKECTEKAVQKALEKYKSTHIANRAQSKDITDFETKISSFYETFDTGYESQQEE